MLKSLYLFPSLILTVLDSFILKTMTTRAAFRILLKGGEIAVSAYQGGKGYMLYIITIYNYSKSQGGKHPATGGGEMPPCAPHPPKYNPDNNQRFGFVCTLLQIQHCRNTPLMKLLPLMIQPVSLDIALSLRKVSTHLRNTFIPSVRFENYNSFSAFQSFT